MSIDTDTTTSAKTRTRTKARTLAMAQTLACYAEAMSAARGASDRKYDMVITAFDNDGDPQFNIRIDGYADLTLQSKTCLTVNQAREYIRDTASRLGRYLEVDVQHRAGSCPQARKAS